MRKVFTQLFAGILLMVAGLHTVRAQPDSHKLFVGYVNGQPVFDAYKEKALYILQGEPMIFKKYAENYSVAAINDRYICYQEEIPTGFNAIITDHQTETKYALSSRLVYAALDPSGALYYTDVKERESIKCLKNHEDKPLGIQGFVISVVDGYLYYSKEHDPTLDESPMDIFKFDLTTKRSQRVLVNVSGESTLVLPNQKYIFDHVLLEGQSKPVVYSVDQRKYKLLTVEEKFADETPFYSFRQKCLVFYDPTTLETKRLSLPTSFDLVR